MSELLPLFPLSTVLFPGMRLPLHIFEERYRLLVAHLQRAARAAAVRGDRDPQGAGGRRGRRHRAARGRLRGRRSAQITPHPDGRFDLATVGTERFRLLRVDDSLPYFQGEVEPLKEEAAVRRG